MEDFNARKVPVTIHLTEEAAKILYQYAGERNRGRFLSELLVQQRRRDNAEAEAVAAEAKRMAAVKAAEAATAARERFSVPSPGSSRNKRKKGR